MLGPLCNVVTRNRKLRSSELSGPPPLPALPVVSARPPSAAPDFDEAAENCYRTYGFTNPGHPPCGAGEDPYHMVRPTTYAEFSDQFNRVWTRAIAEPGEGAGGSGLKGAVGGLLALFGAVSDCVANVVEWEDYYHRELRKFQ